MTISRNVLAFVITASLTPAVVRAQIHTQASAGTFYIGPSVELLDAEPFMSQGVVVDAPFSADAVTDFTQVLGDGNRIERHFSSAIARDGRGRTRREQQVALLGPLASLQGEPPMLVTISDPAAHTHYTLDSGQKVAFRNRAAMAKIAATGKVTVAGQFTMAEPFASAHIGTDLIMVDRKSAIATNVTSAHLGTRQIEGVMATGSRTTMTIPAGEIGNIQPIEVVTERWFSNELQEAVLLTRRDPRSGETVYRLTNIVRAEPPADLFAVPSDYEVRDSNPMTQKLHVIAPEQKTGPGGRGVTRVK